MKRAAAGKGSRKNAVKQAVSPVRSLDLAALTLDLDWAPDFIIEQTAQILIKNKIKATWFVTHDSPAIRRLMRNASLFEFGLHPNFLPNSTQGRNPVEIMKALRSILPDAKIVRSHALFQFSGLLSSLAVDFGMKTDVSLFLPGAADLQPCRTYYQPGGKGLVRVPYFWEDDVEVHHPSKSWDFSNPRYHVRGLKIFNFHPLFIYLNMDSLDKYEALKKRGPLQGLDEKRTARYVYRGRGVRSFFDGLIHYLTRVQKQTYTVSDIVKTWNRK